jgi:hypothetical protein
MKKVNGSLKKFHYEVIDYDTGEVVDLKPEYTTMSRRPGIAGDWFDKYKDDSLDAWHLSQFFTSRPTLGSGFIQDNPPFKSI